MIVYLSSRHNFNFIDIKYTAIVYIIIEYIANNHFLRILRKTS